MSYCGNQVITMYTTLTFVKRSKMSLIPYKISQSWGNGFRDSRGIRQEATDNLGQRLTVRSYAYKGTGAVSL